ncbi:phosphopentomutase [Rickettsiales bacterium LUAb2]
MRRAIIIVLDSVGIGYSADSEKYGDWGSNTVGHITEKHPLKIPNLTKLGLVNALKLSANNTFGLKEEINPIASFGYAKEISTGKDTVSGHWEICGCPMLEDWGYFFELQNSFPKELLNVIMQKANLKGYLGNCHASGTEIINRLGLEHITTGYPIFYTSADSVFQIAASEEHFGLDNLYKLCEIAREEVDKYNIGRVIARPFIGNNPSNFTRTSNRKDYATPPPNQTLLDIALANNFDVVAIGKTSDIFSHRGMSKTVKTPNNEEGINQTINSIKIATNNSLIFTNLVDFDVHFGHRRDPKGYGEAIEHFDKRLPEILNALNDDDLLIITADHGNDPTWKGNDHTREHIPVLAYCKNLATKNLGALSTFADIGSSVASYLKLPNLKHGKSFLN